MPCHKVFRPMPHDRQAFAKFLLFVLGHIVCAVRDEMQTGWSDDGYLQKPDPAHSLLNTGSTGSGLHIASVEPPVGVEWHEEQQQDMPKDARTDHGKQRTSTSRQNIGMATRKHDPALAPKAGGGNHMGNFFEGVSRMQLLNVAGGGSTASQTLHGKEVLAKVTFAGAGYRGTSSPADWQAATLQRRPAEDPAGKQHKQSSETDSSSNSSETGDGTHPYPGRSHEWAKYDYKKTTGELEGMTAVVEAMDAAKDKAVDKARAVDKAFGNQQAKVKELGRVMDHLDVSVEKYKQSVEDYFVQQEAAEPR
ncbi:aarA [Symbiodinium sp. CCMP2456]|nr:aarA [Symbiodinium sp. CCMP2456]